MTGATVLFVLAAVFLGCFLVSRRRDPRMLRNGVYLTGTLVFAGVGVLAVLGAVLPGFDVVLGVLALLVPLAVLVLGVFLLANGVRMFRREARSLGNMLSFVFGVLVFVLPAVAILLFALASGRHAGVLTSIGAAIAVLLVLVSAYFAVAFVAFALWSIVYGRLRHESAPDAVVVLGSGLVRGRVPPLLASRLDRGLGVYRSERAAGRSPILIPSGGQGDDEPRSEGTAMAEYLIAHGAAPEDVHPETASRNTRENLLLSHEVQRAAGRSGPILVATNDYHVLRSASLARRLGLDAQVVGARTARYYVPSAFLREFVAMIVDHRWFNVAACVPFLGFAVFLLVETLSRH